MGKSLSSQAPWPRASDYLSAVPAPLSLPAQLPGTSHQPTHFSAAHFFPHWLSSNLLYLASFKNPYPELQT